MVQRTRIGISAGRKMDWGRVKARVRDDRVNAAMMLRMGWARGPEKGVGMSMMFAVVLRRDLGSRGR